jgi:hypothetical protein
MSSLSVIASPCPLAFAEALAQAGQGLAGGPIYRDEAISQNQRPKVKMAGKNAKIVCLI